jgi:MSHA pilin protein MshD
MLIKPKRGQAATKTNALGGAQVGFTLMELVIGMLVMSIAIVMMSTMLFPQSDRAAKTLHRVRSAELAHGILNEIWGKRFDQNTNANGGVPACDSPLGMTCTAETAYGPDGSEPREQFNDVDDYHGLNESSLMLNSSQSYRDFYPNYRLQVSVVAGTAANTKLVTVDVSTPDGEVIRYQALRSNY